MATKAFKIVKKFNNRTIGIRCSFCKGNGTAPSTDIWDMVNTPCPVCKGRGFNIFRSKVDNLTPCKHCDSTGRKWEELNNVIGLHFLGSTCEICKGTGVIVLKFDLSDSEEFDIRNFHSEIVKHAKALFVKHQWVHCVFEVCKAFEEYVKKVSGLNDDFYGIKLMSNAFSKTGPLVLSNLNTPTSINQQEGIMHIAMGVVQLFRNPISHEPARKLAIKKQDALEILNIFNLLYKRIDTAKKR